jgi:hypothetical protein
MVKALQFIIDCEPLKLLEIYEGTCFGLWCLKRANMQQLMIGFYGFDFSEWKKLKLVCKKQLHGQKNQGSNGKNEKRPTLQVGNNTRSWKLLSKQGLLAKL